MKNFIGCKFGRLTVVAMSEPWHRGDAGKKISAKWACACECGTIVAVTKGNLTSGATSSCGCLKKQLQTTHGMTKDPLYKTWVSIRLRIADPTNKDYANYGGRGLTMEPEWTESFPPFREWVLANVGPKPSANHTIDRVENSLGYLKGNIRWATDEQQQNNRRSNRLITFQGSTLNMKQWCIKLGLNYGAVKMRLGSMGWSVEQALGTATDGSRCRKVR